MPNIDRILISCDDNPLYIQFLPIVSFACQKILDIRPTMAYITDRKELDWKWMFEYCQDIVRFPVDKGLPNGKCRTFAARMVMRYKFKENEVCMVSDIDMIPLNKRVFRNIADRYVSGYFLSHGYNVLKDLPDDPGIANPQLRKFPSCYTVAEARVWKEIINPFNLNDDDLVKSWYNIHYYDQQESVNKENFCDESLMRALIQKWSPSRDKVIGIDRKSKGLRVFDRLDRSNWKFNRDTLERNDYIDAHCPRPLDSYSDSIKLVTEFIGIPFIIGGK